jgi:hypothetical protein
MCLISKIDRQRREQGEWVYWPRWASAARRGASAPETDSAERNILPIDVAFCPFGSLRNWLPDADSVVYAAGESGCGFSGKLSGWNYTMRCSPEADRLNVDFDLKKSLGSDNTPNASVEISGVGYIQNFDTSLDISVTNNLVQSLTFGNKNLNGVLDFTGNSGFVVGSEL